MANKRGYRLLVALMSVTLICLVVAAFHRFTHALMFIGARCCLDLSMLLPVVVTSWFVVSVRTVTFVTLLTGFGLVLRPLWRTYRFVAHLKTASQAGAHVFVPERLMTLCAELNLTQQVVMLATPIPLAFCFGLLKPRICLSTGLIDALSDQELKAVLMHEDFHRRHYDPLRMLLAESMAAMLFFLPAAAEWRDLFLTSTELAADRHAMRLSERFSLAGALHKLLTHPLATQFSVTGMADITGMSATNARFAQLLDNAPFPLRFSKHSLISSSLLLILVCMALQISLF